MYQISAVVGNHSLWELSKVFVLFALSTQVTYVVVQAIYNVFFHPLRQIPGPLLARATDFVHTVAVFSGNGVKFVKNAHDRYGQVVRIGPNRVSCNTSSAIKEIYGRRPGGADLIKDPELYVMPPSGVRGIGESDDINHSRQRKYTTPAFSAKALEEQESLITGRIDILIDQLKKREGQTVNMVQWLDWTLFDMIGILTLSFDFCCLKNASYHPWISDMFTNFKYMGLMFAAKSIPGLTNILELLISKSIFEQRARNFNFLRSLVLERIDSKEPSNDFMSYILKYADPDEVKDRELETNTWSIIIAGSETTATLLDGTLYHLLSNLDRMNKLVKMIRTKFPSSTDITAARLAEMPYLLAVLDESMRMYPPAPFGLSRVVPAPGTAIGEYFLSTGSRASASHWAVFHSQDNFTDPDTFVPERWLPDRDERYTNDNREALMPFSAGKRNCIAKNLALIQMRLILASLLWHFDFELRDSSRDWDNQKVFMAWAKNPLDIRVHVRKGADSSRST